MNKRKKRFEYINFLPAGARSLVVRKRREYKKRYSLVRYQNESVIAELVSDKRSLHHPEFLCDLRNDIIVVRTIRKNIIYRLDLRPRRLRYGLWPSRRDALAAAVMVVPYVLGQRRRLVNYTLSVLKGTDSTLCQRILASCSSGSAEYKLHLE